MAPPTPLAIATSSLQRLVKEEISYEKELKGQEARLEKIIATKDQDENAEYQLKQERTAIQETKNVFPPLRERIKDALQRLQDQVEDGESNGADEAEITKAKEVIESAKEASRS
ncbi:tubulin binding cofactor A [Leptodontidium sp. 2 PMI_412]|nr:tubulin binding cofactor A [Leptodontidium sp. 2 PMI_412]